MDDEIHRKVRDLITSSVSDGLFPGAVWHAEERGVILTEGHTGCAELGPQGREISSDSVFDLASLTKPVCCGTLCLLMSEEGRLDLGEPVGSYVPEFSGGWRDDVRVVQLLCHSSGLPSGIPLSRICREPGEVLDAVCRSEMAYAPGTRSLYSDVGFILLGKMLERLTGSPLDRLAQIEVFGPLGMDSSMFVPGPHLSDRLVATQQLASGQVLVGQVHDGNARFMGGISGNAGLFSSVADLCKFCRMMLGREGSLLSASTISEATRIWIDDGANAYGLSWFKRRSPENPASIHFSPEAYGHTGYTGTSIWIDPARDFFAILLTNRVHPLDRTERIPEMNRVRRRFHNMCLGF